MLAARHFTARKTALNRLRLLVRAGYLSSERLQLLEQPAPVLFYSPTPKGRHALARLSLTSQGFADA